MKPGQMKNSGRVVRYQILISRKCNSPSLLGFASSIPKYPHTTNSLLWTMGQQQEIVPKYSSIIFNETG